MTPEDVARLAGIRSLLASRARFAGKGERELTDEFLLRVIDEITHPDAECMRLLFVEFKRIAGLQAELVNCSDERDDLSAKLAVERVASNMIRPHLEAILLSNHNVFRGPQLTQEQADAIRLWLNTAAD